MDGAFMAFGLPLSELAPVEPRCCVRQQLPALFTKFLFFVFFKAPQFYHMSDCGFLPFNSFHYSSLVLRYLEFVLWQAA